MNTARIQTSLQTLFQDDTRWAHSGRRVVFWYDPEAQFQETFDELTLPNVEKLQLADTPFTTKYRLLIQEPTQNFLLYAPFPEPPPHENWLLDLQKSALSFSADRAALIFTEFGFRQRSLETTIREHLRFFDSRKRLDALLAMRLPSDTSDRDLLLAMQSVLVNLKMPDAPSLLRRVLQAGLLESDNPLWADLTRFLSAQSFWQTVQAYTDFHDPTPSLLKFFTRLLITHFEKSLHGLLPAQLERQVITPGQRAYAFIEQWMRDQQDSKGWQELSQSVSKELNVANIISHLTPDALYETATFEDVDQLLIRTCVQALKVQSGDLTRWLTWFQSRQTLVWFPRYAAMYQALEAAIALLELKQKYAAGFRQSSVSLFKSYASEFYLFDRTYRAFIAASDSAHGDILKPLVEDIESLYTNWYLETLGEAWSDALTQKWELPNVLPQTQFFSHYISPILNRDREKAFVIISDALRYEVATELKEQIEQELRGTTSIEAQFGVLPSITRLGMAALLPGSKLEFSPDASDVYVDGLSSKGSVSRLQVLKQNSSVSPTVLPASDLLMMSTEQGREAIRPHRLIYIYHDCIDAIGDKSASERQVFKACEDAIAELLRLVKKICNSLNGTYVTITADHGFLYQRKPIEEPDKISLPQASYVITTGRRAALCHSPDDEPGLLTFQIPYCSDGKVAVVPRGSLRFSIKGAGSQYVHGGASLQEICVPVITYHHQRAKGDDGPVRKVGVQVNARSRRITNNRFSIHLMQTDPVEGRYRTRTVTVGLYDPQNITLISDLKVTVLSSISPHPTEREVTVRLTITISSPPASALLIVRDQEDESELIRETWAVNLGITNDFGDF